MLAYQLVLADGERTWELSFIYLKVSKEQDKHFLLV
jgi:hypothetical protein